MSEPARTMSHLQPAGSRAAWRLFVGWLVGMAAILALPGLLDSPTLGDDLTRWTVRLALLYYALAVLRMLYLRTGDWSAATEPGQLARLSWTLAWVAYLVHLAMAFHFYHGWSHAHAMEHTRAVAGFGEGIYISHLFTFLWTLDVLYWWLWPRGYAARPVFVGGLLHAFMLFIIFNGTVVYEAGIIRWAGLILFGTLAGAAVHATLRRA